MPGSGVFRQVVALLKSGPTMCLFQRMLRKIAFRYSRQTLSNITQLVASFGRALDSSSWLYIRLPEVIYFQPKFFDGRTVRALHSAFSLEPTKTFLIYRPNPIFATEITNVRLYRTDESASEATHFVATNESGSILGPYIRANGSALDAPKRYARLVHEKRFGPAGGTDEQVLVDFALPMLEAGRNFGHFVVSHLPKIRHWLGAYQRGSGPTLLLDGHHHWQLEILEMLGVPPERVCAIGQNVSDIYVDRYCWTDEKYLGGRTPSFCLENLRWLQSQFCRPLDASPSRRPRLLYLEREPAARRVVLNGYEVRTLVESLGGQTMVPAEYPVREQFDAVSTADVLLVTNGTEALHAIFSPARHIICLVPPGPHHFGIVPAILGALGKDFVPVYDESVPPAEVPPDLRNINADISQLHVVLQQVLARSS